MNKANGVKDTASASTSLYSKEPTYKQRPSSSAFPTFIKWFKKNEKRHKTVTDKLSGKSSQFSDSHDTLSPPSSPFLGNLTPSSSCDSVLSTSTTGFAFVKPQYYKPYSNAEEPKILITDSPETESYRRREKKYSSNVKQPQISLREKYFLYDTDTLTSNDISETGYDNIKYFDRSLPNTNKSLNDTQNKPSRRRHRRAVSESSKDKKSGAYVHVKGKRKAPPPPFQLTNGPQSENKDLYEDIGPAPLNSLSEIYSSGSTLGRKKRRAPLPPLSPKSPQDETPKSIFSEGLLDDKEIKAIIEGAESRDKSSEEKLAKMFTKRISAGSNEPGPNDKIGSLNNEDLALERTSDRSESPNKSPISPISPRPWYKRPISSHRDSSIPFKREVVLKTMEKRKHKCKEKETVSNILPEVGYSRSSMFDSGHKFGFLLRHKDHSDENKSKDKEKRRSGIGIPNISELDREAAEIVNKEHAHEKAREKAEQEKFFNPPEHLLLQQQMFAAIGQEETNSDISKQVSTKDLISQFESTSNATRITLNTSFIGRTENFFQDKMQNVTRNEDKQQTVLHDTERVANESTTDTSKPPTIFSNKELAENPKIEVSSAGNEQSKDGKLEQSATNTTWSCPFCTLLNPNWRIICEACERLAPYDKVPKTETKVGRLPNPLNYKTNDDKDKSSAGENATLIADSRKSENFKPTMNPSPVDWEKKTEKVMKYFMPRSSNNVLSKSSSESAVVKKPPVSRKSPSPSKLPLSSPNFSRRYMLQSVEKNQVRSSPARTLAAKETDKKVEKEAGVPGTEKKQPLLDSSVIVTTITPVFYATTTVLKQPESINKEKIETAKHKVNLKEVRSARLAKFSPTKSHISSTATTSTNNQKQQIQEQQETLLNDDPASLEREKQRLREKIRAMNARALAEKYPILPKDTTQQSLQSPLNTEKSDEAVRKNSGDEDATKHGAIRKILQRDRLSENRSPEKLQNEPKTQCISSKAKKPKKVSTSVQTSGYIKKTDDSKSSSREILSEDQLEDEKIDNFICNNAKTENLQYVRFSERDKAKVQEISQQLQSPEGISDFKATLRNSSKGISRTDTITLKKIMRNLELAIAEGQDELAAKIAMDLAKMKVSLQVTKVNSRPISGTIDYNQTIIIDLYVEDKVSQKGPIQIPVKPLMTVLELKEKALKDFEIPIELQKWLINDEPATDNHKTLLEYGVRDCTSGFYLYLITPEGKGIEKKEVHLPIPKTSIAVPEDLELDGELSDESSDSHNGIELNEIDGATALPSFETSINPLGAGNWQCPLCTLINFANDLVCNACSKAKPQSTNLGFTHWDKFNISDELRQFLKGDQAGVQYRSSEQKNDLNKTTPNRKSSEMYNIIENKIAVTQVLNDTGHVDFEAAKKGLNFSSPNITKNKYRGVDNYNPNRKNTDGTSTTTESAPSPIKKPKPRAPAPPTGSGNNHYQELLQLDTSDAVLNKESFECPVCFMNFQPGEGIVLRDCLHSFCKECLSNTIRYSDEAEVKCPYMDAIYSCDSILQEREIKATVTKEMYEQHLAKSIRVAEHQIENAFHCKTPNCRGWCIYEDNVNEFKCPVCRITNCLMCRVIHDGLTCKQYQDRLNTDCDSNLDARRTKDMIKEMVEKGEAMNCPTCQVIMMKKWGCDWLKCSMCKTEVCWVTRGPRWGPGGKGDTTGGCKCGVDGKKCHPKCNYCH